MNTKETAHNVRCPHSFYVPPHNHTHEAVYHFSTNSVRHVVPGFSEVLSSSASCVTFKARRSADADVLQVWIKIRNRSFLRME